MVGLAVPSTQRRLVCSVALIGMAIAGVAVVALLLAQPWHQPVVNAGLPGAWNLLRFSTVVDGLSVTVATLVVVVSSVVQVFSLGYLRDHSRYSTYAALVSLFTAAMLLVVVADDLLTLIVGWEVMGLCSYALIGQYWEQPEARAAAMKSFLVTKLGDAGFILGIIVLATAAHTFSITAIVGWSRSADPTLVAVGSLLLFAGVAGKSAQFPLHGWLPDAMTGPSPVSALIHAATMVAAGVFVVVRLYPLFATSSVTLAVVGVVACISMVGAAIAALTQQDLKRVLAYSTISQLALMLAATSIGATSQATFQLLAHGCFKALLFLAAGSVIHATGTGQLAALGGVRRQLPRTSSLLAIGLLALAGVPVFSGFFSKESILVAAQHAATGEATVARWLGVTVLISTVTVTFLTAAYCMRLWLLTCCGESRTAGQPHEVSVGMRAAMTALAVPSVGLGFLGLSAAWLPTWSWPDATQRVLAHALRPDLLATVISLALVSVAALAVWSRWRREGTDLLPQRRWVLVARAAFGTGRAYQALAIAPFQRMATAVDRFDDRVVVGGVDEIARGTYALGRAVTGATPANPQRALIATVCAVVVVGVVVAVLVVFTTP